jgi:hypothetical protein
MPPGKGHTEQRDEQHEREPADDDAQPDLERCRVLPALSPAVQKNRINGRMTTTRIATAAHIKIVLLRFQSVI